MDQIFNTNLFKKLLNTNSQDGQKATNRNGPGGFQRAARSRLSMPIFRRAGGGATSNGMNNNTDNSQCGRQMFTPLRKGSDQISSTNNPITSSKTATKATASSIKRSNPVSISNGFNYSPVKGPAPARCFIQTTTSSPRRRQPMQQHQQHFRSPQRPRALDPANGYANYNNHQFQWRPRSTPPPKPPRGYHRVAPRQTRVECCTGISGIDALH